MSRALVLVSRFRRTPKSLSSPTSAKIKALGLTAVAVFELVLSLWNVVLYLDARAVKAMPPMRPKAAYCKPTITASCTHSDLRSALASSRAEASTDIRNVLAMRNNCDLFLCSGHTTKSILCYNTFHHSMTAEQFKEESSHSE